MGALCTEYVLQKRNKTWQSLLIFEHGPAHTGYKFVSLVREKTLYSLLFPHTRKTFLINDLTHQA